LLKYLFFSSIKKLEKDGKAKLIRITEDSNNRIIDTVETSFPCLKNRNWRFFCCNSTSDLKVATIPERGWNIKELKKISGCRKKIYVGVISQQIQPTTNFQSTANFQPPTNYQPEANFQPAANFQQTTNFHPETTFPVQLDAAICHSLSTLSYRAE